MVKDNKSRRKPEDKGYSDRCRKRILLSEIYNRYWNELCHYVSKTFGPGPPEPEDVVQTTIIKYATVKDYCDIQNTRAYLYRTAYNFVIDCKRREYCFDNYVQQEKIFYEKQESFVLSPERILMSREILKTIENTIHHMAYKRQYCLLLHRIHGMSFTEIGRHINMSGPAVSWPTTQVSPCMPVWLPKPISVISLNGPVAV